MWSRVIREYFVLDSASRDVVGLYCRRIGYSTVLLYGSSVLVSESDRDLSFAGTFNNQNHHCEAKRVQKRLYCSWIQYAKLRKCHQVGLRCYCG